MDLWGRSHVEVVGGLSGLRGTDVGLVRLAVGRRRHEPIEASMYLPAEASTAAGGVGSSVGGGGSVGGVGGSERLVKAKSEPTLWESAGSREESLLLEVARRLRSKSLEPLSGLAVWSTQGLAVSLTKGPKGLGFSVLDYQDPLHPAERIIVIRSLVPGGVAALDGRVVPGDRLLRVNQVSPRLLRLFTHAYPRHVQVDLCNASLETAVAALKSAPRGPVRLVVAKPLPLHQEVGSPPKLRATSFHCE